MTSTAIASPIILSLFEGALASPTSDSRLYHDPALFDLELHHQFDRDPAPFDPDPRRRLDHNQGLFDPERCRLDHAQVLFDLP
jgi:hypothetical protein